MPESELLRGTSNSDDDMCRIDEEDFMVGEVKLSSSLKPGNVNNKVSSYFLAFPMS